MSEENFNDINLKVESVLFSYGDWLTISEIQEAINVDSETLVKNALSELIKKYEQGYSYMVEEEDNGKFRMVLREEFDGIVSSLISGTEIPRNVLKVLSVIAYEQPVTKTRLSEIVGRYVKPEVDYLFKAKFLSYDKQGIAKYYKVTKKFYDYFKIDNEDEFKEAANKNMKEYLKEPVAIENEIDEENTKSEKTKEEEIKS